MFNSNRSTKHTKTREDTHCMYLVWNNGNILMNRLSQRSTVCTNLFLICNRFLKPSHFARTRLFEFGIVGSQSQILPSKLGKCSIGHHTESLKGTSLQHQNRNDVVFFYSFIIHSGLWGENTNFQKYKTGYKTGTDTNSLLVKGMCDCEESRL